jgi:hypothetical protein
MFSTQWSVYAKQIYPIWEDLARELKDVPNLVFGSYDLTLNDPVDETIVTIPDFFLYEKNTKKTENFRYDGEKTLSGFKEFLKEKSSAY